MSKESIKEYFKGKTVFVTGGTGFIGKTLLEHLLRTCPDLKRIYVLIRPKKGKSPYERIEQITSPCLFDLLRQKYPENIKKILPLTGDTTQLGLGLSDKDRHLLIDEVQVFFHAAASVKFDDFLKDAILTNIRSAREAALLALEMNKIEVFMHVSTTYCNIDNRKVVEPRLYPPHGNWREVIMLAENCDTEIFNTISRKFIGDFINTYIYTKQLAEHCINDLLSETVPTVLFRPSVVISTTKDPFQGWIDNFNGPTGLLIAGGSGLLRTVYGDPDLNTDYVAVDNIVKCMIVAVWHKVHFGKRIGLDIYNGSKYNKTLFKSGTFVELGKRLYWDVPFSKKIWFPGNTMTKCWYNYYFNVILFHMVPALFLDLLTTAAGHQPRFVKIQRKIYIANMALTHFMLNEWSFVNTNTMGLLEFIPKHEVDVFAFNNIPETEERVYEYYLASCDTARQVLLKEGKEITEKTRTMTRRMYYLDRAFHWIFYGIVFWLVFTKINIISLIVKVFFDYWDRL